MNLLDNILAIFFWLIATSIIHVALSRFSPGKFMLKGLLLGISSCASLGVYFYHQGTVDIIGLFIFFTAWLFYLMAFINLLNSATLKMLEKLHNEPNGFLYADDFEIVFNEEDGLKTRLASMELNGFIAQKNHVIILTSKAQIFLKIIYFLRKLLSIDYVG